MSQISRIGVPLVRRVYEIRLPSGDQAGSTSSRLGSEIRRAPEPSARMTKMSPGLRAKAILCPSADQVGCESSSFVDVSRIVPLPSAFITKMSNVPLRLLANAILLPSGDHAGSTW